MKRECALLFSLIACGPEPGPQITAQVWIASALHTTTQTVAIYALSPERSDGSELTCIALLDESVSPTNNSLELFARAEVDVSQTNAGSVALGGVSSGDGRIIYVTAHDGSGVLIGNGCNVVDVPSGGSVDVTITVRPR